MRMLGFSMDKRSCEVYGGGDFTRFVHVKVDLGSRGRCQVLFTPGNLDIISKGPCIWIRRFVSEKTLTDHCGFVRWSSKLP